jgi:hypothetical protein
MERHPRLAANHNSTNLKPKARFAQPIARVARIGNSTGCLSALQTRPNTHCLVLSTIWLSLGLVGQGVEQNRASEPHDSELKVKEAAAPA